MTIWYQSIDPGEATLYISPSAAGRSDGEAEYRLWQGLNGDSGVACLAESGARRDATAVNKLDQGVTNWRPQVEAAVKELREEVGDIRQQMDLLGKSQSAPPATSSPRVPLTDEERKAPLLPTPPASRVAAAGDSGDKWASGRQHPHEHRGRAPGVVTTVVPTSVKGTFSSPAPSLGILDWENDFDSGERRFNHRVPKLDFPKFDGSDPHDWRMKCEHYFDVNNTYPGLWVRVSIIYFSGRAASWLRSTRAHLRFPNWEDFCAAVSDKFDRDQHDSLIRQMDQIKQTGSVWEYYERFDELMNQLLVYDPGVNMCYLTHRFIDGLRREIRNAVLLQRPKNLESALAVASLQEEVLESSDSTPVKEGKKFESSGQHKTGGNFKGAFPLPLPPGRHLGVIQSARVDEKKEGEIKRLSASSEKVSALKAQRRAQGLCYICAEKWSPTHKCANTVQLHAVQELFSVLHEACDEAVCNPENSVLSDSQVLMAISVHAVQGSEASGCMRMLGQIQGKDVFILVDSGSTASFISARVAEGLSELSQIATNLQVKVADGATLHCQSEIPACEWSTQGQKFCTTLKILPLGNYDMILGMDWLMQHSPMTVNWVTKSLTIEGRNPVVTLQGILSNTAQCGLIPSK
ncbi:Os02g0566300 [Oryza sativa Japonica Group]|jgi:hypothetical protein|uniref:Os02g0566300 protein n=2 Tax=Oryza sativa subsp. japonica TaxID=39947 RepID=A0A0P0VKJ5_ORYSJ|nr:uncharacterized protein LOC4329708 [Oryza sativa Japonica Group]KAB8087548.1 hypothetical protein EE612_011858 [Oryza sativa]BAS79307.1 Os02g0566300 [Oryza sativa Japonica Group]